MREIQAMTKAGNKVRPYCHIQQDELNLIPMLHLQTE